MRGVIRHDPHEETPPVIDYPNPNVDEWAAELRGFAERIVSSLGGDPQWLRTNPDWAIALVDRGIAEDFDPTVMDEDDRHRFRGMLMAVTGEFLLNAHGAHWAWLLDDTSPLGGRWVVTGFTHPLGQKTHPVDIGRISDDALSLRQVQVIDLINTAERESGLRVIA
ncbi:hypothetical protein ACFU7Y_39185 [Kitasatospora sp. NPDC057542]|uniref:hypothetical protein n=1 Tax=Streptomycetaceae TaxID=2062 RepID=UPI001CCAFB3F|nr:hypothetical protein [Streptomyces sp. LS1784]